MLCRALLAAIAISCTFSSEIPANVHDQSPPSLVQIKDVMCVLLLGGLQKEDLDASMLDKLRRHNVNIYDMNNESLREECLLKSFLNIDKGALKSVSTEDDNSTSVIPLKKKGIVEGSDHPDKQKPKIPEKYNYGNDYTKSIIIQNKPQDAKIEASTQLVQNFNPNNDDVTKSGQNVVSIHGNKDPLSLTSFFQLLKQFTPVTKTIITITPTVETSATTSKLPHADNTDYVDTKEPDYVSKLIAEYLANQTVSTTTQVTIKQTESIDILSEKIKQILAERLKLKHKDVAPVIPLQRAKYISEISGFQAMANKGIAVTVKNQVIPQKITITENDQKTESLIKVMPSAVNEEMSPKKEILRNFDDILRANKKISMRYVENTNESTTLNENQEKPANNNASGNKREYANKTNINYNSRRFDSTVNTKAEEPLKVVSSDMIQAIAEKVKEIVIKDIKKEIPTTEAPRSTETRYRRTTTSGTTPTTSTTSTTSATTTTRTPAPTTTVTSTTTEKPTTPQEEIKKDDKVYDTLMKMFNTLNTIKDKVKLSDEPTKMTDDNHTLHSSILPPLSPAINPNTYDVSIGNLKQVEINPSDQFVPIPLGPRDKRYREDPYTSQESIYHKILPPSPIMLQTNSGQIPPLAVPLPGPSIISQNIMVTTVNPFEKQKEREQQRNSMKRINKLAEIIDTANERYYPTEVPTYVDLNKRPRIAENVKTDYIDTFKERIKKLKEKIKLAQAQDRYKARQPSRPLDSGQQIGFSQPLQPRLSSSDQRDKVKKPVVDQGSGNSDRLLGLSYLALSSHDSSDPRIGSDYLSEPSHADTDHRFDGSILDKPRTSMVKKLNQDYSDHQTNKNHFVEPKNNNFDYHIGPSHLQEPNHENIYQRDKPDRFINPSYGNSDLRVISAAPNLENSHYRFGESKFLEPNYDNYDHRDDSNDRKDPYHIIEIKQERPRGTNYQQTLGRIEASNRESYSRPKHTNYQEASNRPKSYKHRPVGNNEHRPVHRPRAFLTREILSQLDSNRKDILSRLVKYSKSKESRPVSSNQQSRGQYSEAHTRMENQRPRPQSNGAKYHEKLEHTENWTRDNYKLLSEKNTDNCCDLVAARQQTPLTKNKQFKRFDDKHFNNFLKSQQKVTDMLERILASKSKMEEPPSVETT